MLSILRQIYFFCWLGLSLGGSGLATIGTYTYGDENRDDIETRDNIQTPGDFETPAGQTVFDVMRIDEGQSQQLPPFRSIIINRLIAERGSKIEIAVQNSGGDGGGGQPGAPGGDGTFSPIWIREIVGDIVIEARGGDGGAGVTGRDGNQGRTGDAGRRGRTLFYGLIYLSRGEDGSPGYPGENGEDGGSGGDGGRGGQIVVVYAKKSSDSSIVVDASGGQGGPGGRGGLGGLGGNGGRGAERGWGGGRQGPMGPQGMHGRSGAPGRPGHPGQVSMYHISEALFDCLSFIEMELEFEDIPFEERSAQHYETCREIALKDREVIRNIQSQSDNQISAIQDLLSQPLPFHFASDGRDGVSAPTSFGFPPFDGSSASSGGGITLVFRDLPDRATISARGGRGGDGAQGVKGRDGRGGSDGRRGGLFRKSKLGENGENGENGGSGSHGGAGGHGGHVRVVWLTTSAEDYDANWRQRFEVTVSGGLGGHGGLGGIGGRGGLGGEGGKRFLIKDRRDDGQPGLPGLPGLDGLDGVLGDDGHVEFIEIENEFDWIIEDLVSR